MSRLCQRDDVYSNNYFAEMLLKNVGAHFGGAGTTAAGAAVAGALRPRHGSGVHAVDGSGLTPTKPGGPGGRSGRLLQSMRAASRSAGYFVDGAWPCGP
jgi:hypothetical protein